MGNLIPEEKINEVRNAADILEIISEVVTLKQAGANYKGLCPFHEEKTPSFQVNPVKQFYHCFGCHKGGDVVRFVMDHEKATFPEAVRMLGKRYGIVVETESGGRSERDREDLYQVLKWAADTYHKQLLVAPESESVRAYVRERGISVDSTATFRLGCAPEEWDFLLKRARKENKPDTLLLEAGLIVPRKEKDGAYDRFRGRLMFPIFDVRDRIIGFGGRILPGSNAKEQAKYINTSETSLFSKGRILYGLNFAREAAAKEGALAIVEGYTDVILAHQNGFRFAVATLGTALTRDHVRLMRRFTDRVLAVYDGDSAGEKASERSLDIFLEEDLEFRVASMPEGLDPADCFQQKGPEVFRGVLDAAIELFQYRLELARKRHDCLTVDGKTKAVDMVLGSIALVPNDVKRQLQTEKLSKEMDVPVVPLLKRLAALRAQLQKTTRPQPGTPDPQPVAPPAAVPEQAPRHKREAAKELIDLMLSAPALIPRVREAVPLAEFPTEISRGVAERVFHHWDRFGELRLADFLGSIEDAELSGKLAGVVAEGEKKGNHEARLAEILEKISLWRRESDVRDKKKQVGDDDGLRAFMESRRALDAQRNAKKT